MYTGVERNRVVKKLSKTRFKAFIQNLERMYVRSETLDLAAKR